jgi:predicted RND superfamily exporter protein
MFVFLIFMGLCSVGLWQAQRVSLAAKMTDYYPSTHPHVNLYQQFSEMLRMANTVVVTVTVKDGTIYTNETLGKIHRLTVDLIETRGVNANEVMSLTHPRLKDIRVSSEDIEIMPVVRQPGETLSPEALARIKNAVYTNLGIRGVYVSPDDKTALIRAGFWDGMVDPQQIFARLQNITVRERDANTEIHFTGNLILAAWLRTAASRILLLLLVSGILTALICGLSLSAFQASLLVFVVNVVAALVGFGLLGAWRLTFEPLLLFVLLPLTIRGVTLVVSWQTHLGHASRLRDIPFETQASQLPVLEYAAAQTFRPLTVALCVDGLAFLSLVASDVPLLCALGVMGIGWNIGLLLVLWILLPLWSATFRVRRTVALHSFRTERLVTRLGNQVRQATFSPSFISLVVLALAGFGLVAGWQLEAGREVMGATLFYPSHPYNQAFSLVNEKFIGTNQLIIVARTDDEVAFRHPHALRTIEAFQHYMAEDRDFGGTLAITNLIKSVTRMFHENVPKWEIIPDDIDSAGQIVFRIISSAATPSEVSRLFSQDFRATAVTFFYRQYSPSLALRVLTRARTFMSAENTSRVQFYLGGGVLGILAAIHDAVEQNYWRFVAVFVVLSVLGAMFATRSFRAVCELSGILLLMQATLLLLLWWGEIDLNMYSLPVVVVGLGMCLPAFYSSSEIQEDEMTPAPLVTTCLITVLASAVWLFSPLRLQAEMGVVLIVLALAAVVLSVCVRSIRVEGKP